MTEAEVTTQAEVITEESVDLIEDIVEPGQEIDPVAALTADLQRLQAEYANYRKRVERDRLLASEIATAAVLNELLPLLDGLDRASEHGELTGGFKAISDQITSITSRIGLIKFGEAGAEFDPQIHDALMHETSTQVLVSTATKILQPGYKFKERTLRPASVVVTDPAGE
jgi:molecular chaperone GrpE